MIPSLRPIGRMTACLLAAWSLTACAGDGEQSISDSSVMSVMPVMPDMTTSTVGATIATDDAPAASTGVATTEAIGTTTASSGSTAPVATAAVTGAGATTTAKPGATPPTTSVAVAATTAAPTPIVTPASTSPVTNPVTVPAPVTPAPAPAPVTATVAYGSPRTIRVDLGAFVNLTVTSSVEQEFHVHGYDITNGGTRVGFQFTADMAGTFIVESHTNPGVVVCTLVVA